MANGTARWWYLLFELDCIGNAEAEILYFTTKYAFHGLPLLLIRLSMIKLRLIIYLAAIPTYKSEQSPRSQIYSHSP